VFQGGLNIYVSREVYDPLLHGYKNNPEFSKLKEKAFRKGLHSTGSSGDR